MITECTPSIPWSNAVCILGVLALAAFAMHVLVKILNAPVRPPQRLSRDPLWTYDGPAEEGKR